MKHFSLFLVKKALKSRLNVIIVVLLTIVISIAFYMNSRTAQKLSLESQIQSSIVKTNNLLKKMKINYLKRQILSQKNISLQRII